MGSSYLAQYGAGDERRIRRTRLIVWTGIGIVALLIAGYFVLHNLPERRVANRFLDDVNKRDLRAAYDMWCPAAHPCPNYDFNRFQQDWAGKNNAAWTVSSTDSCKYFLTVNVDAQGEETQSLAIQRSDLSLGFAPAPECQEKKWRFRQFWDRITGKAPKQGT